MTLYANDQFLYPIEIESGANSATIDLDGTDHTIEVDPGAYWAIKSSESAFDDYPSIYEAIEAQAPVEFSGGDPSDTDLPGAGLEITASGASLIEIDLSVADALPGRIFGMESGTSLQQSGTWRSPWTRGPAWHPPKAADRKFEGRESEGYTSGGRGDAFQATTWGVDRVRLFEYARIPAAFVRRDRARSDAHATIAGAALGDVHNEFWHFWQHGIASFDDVIVHHDRGPDHGGDLSSLDPAGSFEIVRSNRGSQYADELDQCLDLTTDGEYYNVEFGMFVKSGSYRKG